MKHQLLKLVLPLLLLLLAPAVHVHAQSGSDNTSTVTATDGSNDEQVDNKKKKAKEKDDDAEFFTFNAIEKFNAAFFVRLLIDILAMFILIRLIYFPVYKRRDHLFTFFMFNMTIFMITFLLNNKSGLSTGAAFGMFAVFSLLRYRTEDISARDMTYLFITIALGLISSINRGNILETSMIDVVILAAAFLLDGGFIIKTEFVKTVQYENIELIRPENYAKLLADLRSRTGLNIHKVSVGRVDFLRDTATLKIYYREGKNSDSDFQSSSEQIPGTE